MSSVKIAVIGTGRFGKHYVRLLKESGTAELIQTANSSSNLEELLANKELDGVVIATPASTHFDLARRALLANKDVLLEKPMTLNLGDAMSLSDMVKKSQRVFMVGHQYLYNDYIRYLKKIIEKKEISEIHHFKSVHLYPGPVREDVGVFWDAVPHEISIADYLFGPVEVLKASGEATKQEGHRFDDSVKALISTKSGVGLDIEVSSVASKKIRKFEFVGSMDRVIYDDMRELGSFQINSDIVTMKTEEPLKNQLNHFVECIKKREQPLTDIEHGVRVVRALSDVANMIGQALK